MAKASAQDRNGILNFNLSMLLLVDTLGRTVSFGADVPTGIITVLVAPYFLYLLSKH